MKIKHSKIKWPSKKLILFLGRLSLYMSARMKIDLAIRECSDLGNKKDRQICEKIAVQVSTGRQLSSSLDSELNISKTVIGIIGAGEQSGRLVASLMEAKIMIEKIHSMRSRIISAMIYPLVIAVFSLLLVIGLIRGVLPEIVPMLKGLSIELPLLTRIIIFISDYISNNGIYIIAVLIFVFIVIFYSYKQFEFIKYLFHKIIIHTPLVGKIFVEGSISIWLRSMGSLISARERVNDAYNVTVESVFLVPLRRALIRESRNLSQGKSLGNVFEQIKSYIPRFVIGIVHAGESAGSLGPALIQASEIVDSDLEHKIKRITSLIEPVLMVSMGFIIGAIALSIILPIYDISKTLQH